MPSPRGLDTKQTKGSNFFIKVFLLGLGKFYLKRFSRFEIFSMYVAKMTGIIRTDIRQGGSVPLCETYPC